jgi:hypothetical protein
MSGGIVPRNEDDCAGDARLAQARDAFLDKAPANTLPVMCGRHRQVIDQAAPAIVPAEHRADDRPVLFRDATKTWVAREISAYFLFRIALGDFDSFDDTPKCHDLVIVIDDKFPGSNRRHMALFRDRYLGPCENIAHLPRPKPPLRIAQGSNRSFDRWNTLARH